MPRLFQFRTRKLDKDIEEFIEQQIKAGKTEAEVIREMLRLGMVGENDNAKLARIDRNVKRILKFLNLKINEEELKDDD